MADLYDINFTQYASDVIPNKKRTTTFVAAIKGFMSGIKRLWTLFLSYKRGAIVTLSPTYWYASTFSKGSYVIYDPEMSVWEAQATTSTEPTTSTDWLKVADSFIGSDERRYFYGGNLSLTYALNLQYGTLFVDDPASNTSDIYIVDVPRDDEMFTVGISESESSSIYSDTCSESITSLDTNPLNYKFKIWVPAWRFPTFGATEDAYIRKFVDRYVTTGCKYLITDY